MLNPVDATEGQIARGGAAFVVAGDDVVDLEGNVRGGLPEQAVFASAVCPMPHQLL